MRTAKSNQSSIVKQYQPWFQGWLNDSQLAQIAHFKKGKLCLDFLIEHRSWFEKSPLTSDQLTTLAASIQGINKLSMFYNHCGTLLSKNYSCESQYLLLKKGHLSQFLQLSNAESGERNYNSGSFQYYDIVSNQLAPFLYNYLPKTEVERLLNHDDLHHYEVAKFLAEHVTWLESIDISFGKVIDLALSEQGEYKLKSLYIYLDELCDKQHCFKSEDIVNLVSLPEGEIKLQILCEYFKQMDRCGFDQDQMLVLLRSDMEIFDVHAVLDAVEYLHYKLCWSAETILDYTRCENGMNFIAFCQISNQNHYDEPCQNPLLQAQQHPPTKKHDSNIMTQQSSNGSATRKHNHAKIYLPKTDPTKSTKKSQFQSSHTSNQSRKRARPSQNCKFNATNNHTYPNTESSTCSIKPTFFFSDLTSPYPSSQSDNNTSLTNGNGYSAQTTSQQPDMILHGQPPLSEEYTDNQIDYSDEVNRWVSQVDDPEQLGIIDTDQKPQGNGRESDQSLFVKSPSDTLSLPQHIQMEKAFFSLFAQKAISDQGRQERKEGRLDYQPGVKRPRY